MEKRHEERSSKLMALRILDEFVNRILSSRDLDLATRSLKSEPELVRVRDLAVEYKSLRSWEFSTEEEREDNLFDLARSLVRTILRNSRPTSEWTEYARDHPNNLSPRHPDYPGKCREIFQLLRIKAVIFLNSDYFASSSMLGTTSLRELPDDHQALMIEAYCFSRTEDRVIRQELYLHGLYRELLKTRSEAAAS